jgi:hypothetical protein
MKKILFICLLFVTFVILKGESVYNYNRNISWSSKSEQTELEFTVPQYRMETISTEGNTYSRIVTEGEGEYLLPGYPEVPIFSALVAVPDQGRIEFEVTGSEQSVIEDIVLYPRQQLQSESELPSREFVINQQYYQSEELFPVSAAHCSEPVIMRDYRLVRLTFNPFQYDPASQQLLVNERIQVRIYSEAGEGVNELEYKGRPSRYFDKMFSNMIINYESVRREEEFQKPSILYIYINNSTVENYLQYLVDWRRQKGFEVHAVSTSVTGNNTAGIHNYIQEAYDEWENPPEYVCLLGDANGSYNIPCYYVDTGETDNNYVMLEGNDLLPDAAIGRIPFENTGQLAVIITKILNYETEPYMNNTNWFQRGLMVGDASTSGTTCIDSKRYVVDMMEQTAP